MYAKAQAEGLGILRFSEGGHEARGRMLFRGRGGLSGRYIVRIRKATRERTDVVAEEKFCGRVEGKPRNQVLQRNSVLPGILEWKEKTNLEIDRMSFLQTVLELADGILCMAIKVIEVADSIPAEEGTCHRPMKLPELA